MSAHIEANVPLPEPSDVVIPAVVASGGDPTSAAMPSASAGTDDVTTPPTSSSTSSADSAAIAADVVKPTAADNVPVPDEALSVEPSAEVVNTPPTSDATDSSGVIAAAATVAEALPEKTAIASEPEKQHHTDENVSVAAVETNVPSSADTIEESAVPPESTATATITDSLHPADARPNVAKPLLAVHDEQSSPVTPTHITAVADNATEPIGKVTVAAASTMSDSEDLAESESGVVTTVSVSSNEIMFM